MNIAGIFADFLLLLIGKIHFQKNTKKVHKNTTADKIPKFTITSQDMKKINMHVKPVEEKIDNVKKKLKENEMGYDIVEDIKKAKANISLFEMCNVPQQKEKLLKALEVPEDELPTNNLLVFHHI